MRTIMKKQIFPEVPHTVESLKMIGLPIVFTINIQASCPSPAGFPAMFSTPQLEISPTQLLGEGFLSSHYIPSQTLWEAWTRGLIKDQHSMDRMLRMFLQDFSLTEGPNKSLELIRLACLGKTLQRSMSMHPDEEPFAHGSIWYPRNPTDAQNG